MLSRLTLSMFRPLSIGLFLFNASVFIPLFAEEGSEGLTLEKYLPEDTWSVLGVQSLKGFTDEVKAGDIAAGIEAGVWEDFIKPLKESEAFSHLTEMSAGGEPLTWEMFTEHYSGQFVLGVNGVYESEETGSLEPNFYILAEYEGDIEFLLDIATPDIPSEDGVNINIIEEEYLGLTLYLEEVEFDGEVSVESGWALVEGIYVEAFPIPFLKELVERVLNDDSDDSLLANPNFLSVSESLEEQDFYGYANLGAIIPEMLDLATKEMEELPPNPLGITKDKLIEGLELELLEAFYVTLNVDEEQTAFDTGLTYKEKKGLIELLAYSGESIPEINFIPEDALSAGISLYSIPDAIAALESILKKMSPNFESFYQLQLDNVKAQIGIDIKESIIANLGEEIVAYNTSYSEADTQSSENAANPLLLNQVYALKLVDPEGIKTALNVLTGMLGGGADLMTERDYLGTTIYAPKQLEGHQGLNIPTYSYAFMGDYLIYAVGEATALEEPIALMEKSDFIFLNADAVEAAAELMPPHPLAIKYSDLDQLWKLFAESMKNVSRTMPDMEEIPLDFSALSDSLNIPLYILSQLYMDEHSLVTKSLILPKSSENQ